MTGAEAKLFELVIEQLKQKGLVKAGGKQRTDSTHVLAAVRAVNRTEGVAETLRATLNALAVVAPEWLRQQVTPEWYERYSQRIEEYRLPKSAEGRKVYAETVGADGFHLLEAVYSELSPLGQVLQAVPAVEVLRQVWVQHF